MVNQLENVMMMNLINLFTQGLEKRNDMKEDTQLDDNFGYTNDGNKHLKLTILFNIKYFRRRNR